MDRQRLNVAINKETRELIDRIVNHAQSFVHLYVQRKKADIDQQLIEQLNEVFALGVNDGFDVHVDRFSENVNKSLNKYEEELNPTGLAQNRKQK